MYVLQVLVNGITLGGIYALLGLGMSLILGIVKLTNLAHGELVILGAYGSTILATRWGMDPFLTLVITVPLMFLFGFILQYVLINHAMSRGAEPALLVTFGISIMLKDGMQLMFTADSQSISTGYSFMSFDLLGIHFSVLDLLLLGLSMITILLLELFLKKTHTGRAIRAAADDVEAARLSGINVKRTFAIAMGIAAALAAIAGLSVGMKWMFVPSSGGQYLLIALVVVVLGGLGDIRGTLIAGFLFGLIQVIGGANYGLLISYIFMIIMLIISPRFLRGARRLMSDR